MSVINTSYNPVGKGVSLYQFFDGFWKAPAGENDRAMRRLASLMRKMKVQTAIVEELTEDDDAVMAEKSALDKYFGQKLDGTIYRITFSDEVIAHDGDLQESRIKHSFLGYLIVINVELPRDIVVNGLSAESVSRIIRPGRWHSYIYIAAITAPYNRRTGSKRFYLMNNYIHSARSIKGRFLNKAGVEYGYKIDGTFFFQKNEFTSVCAQASLAMTLNNYGLAGVDSIITTEYINDIVGIDHHHTKYHADNPTQRATFTVEHIKKVLDTIHRGLKFVNFFDEPNIDYADYLYQHMESRFPTMLIFTAGSEFHIVPILGHTLNSDLWRPEAELAYDSMTKSNFKDYSFPCSHRFKRRSASAWVDHFIIHDDNFGMYHCMPVESLRRNTLPYKDVDFRAAYGFAVVPKGVRSSALEAEDASTLVVNNLIHRLKNAGIDLGYWVNKIADSMSQPKRNPSPVVARTLLVSKSDYIKYLQREKDYSDNKLSKTEIDIVTNDLPRKFWHTEISLPDLMTTNKTKIIDVYFACNGKLATDNIYSKLIMVRLGKILIKNDQNTAKIKSVENISITNHYPLFTYKEPCKPVEW